jgi:hypothetical protein
LKFKGLARKLSKPPVGYTFFRFTELRDLTEFDAEVGFFDRGCVSGSGL